MINVDLTTELVLIHEYEKLKAEQLARIGTRDNLVYATLASLAAVIAGTLQAGIDEFLLILPPVCLAFGWTYLINDQKVSAIGRHIRTTLAPQLERALDSNVPFFTWEVIHRADRWRTARKIGQLTIDLMTFCAPAVIAASIYLAGWPRALPMAVIAGVELTAIAALAASIVVSADLRRTHSQWNTATTEPRSDDVGDG